MMGYVVFRTKVSALIQRAYRRYWNWVLVLKREAFMQLV